MITNALLALRRARALRPAAIATTVALTLLAMLAAPAQSAVTSPFVDQHERAHTTEMEWWYVTGHLNGVDATGKTYQYGFQSTFFKNHPWWGYDGYIHQMAVTDLNRGTYTQGSKYGTGFTSTACCAGYNVGLQDWDLSGDNGNHRVYGNVNWGDYVLDLDLASTKTPAMHGGDGYVDFEPFGDSGYYSFTGLAATGKVVDHGVTVTITGGEAWMDHQWYDGATTGGWDWYSIQLDNNVDYMLFFVRGADGAYSRVFGSRISPTGVTTELNPNQMSMTPLGSWTSPRSGRTYSSGWQVGIPGGSLTILPKVLDQESNIVFPAKDYWEGASTVTGTINGQAVTGKSFTEITPVQCLCGF